MTTKNTQLPNEVKRIIDASAGDFPYSAVKAYAMLDIALLEGQAGACWSDTLVLLLKDKLLVIDYELACQRIFSGFTKKISRNKSARPAQITNTAICDYPLESIEKMDIESMVIGGTLYIEINGEKQAIASFSNMHAAQVRKLVKIFGRHKKGEETKARDYEDEFIKKCCPKCGALYPDRNREVCPRCIDKRSIFLRLLGFFTVYKKRITIMLISILLLSILNMLWPLLSGRILYDEILGGESKTIHLLNISIDDMLLLLGIQVMVMTLIKLTGQLFGIVQGVMVAKMVPEVVRRIKEQVFESMGRLSMRFFSARQTGALMTRILNDSNEVTFFFIDGLPYLFSNVLVILCSVVMMMFMNWRLGLATVIFLPLPTIIGALLGPRWRMLFSKRYRAIKGLNSQINDNITGARVVKAFGKEQAEVERFDKYNTRLRTAEIDLVIFDNKFSALFIIAQNVITLSVWFVGALLILNKSGISYGTLASFTGFVGLLIGPMDFLSFIYRWWNHSMNSGGRIFEICDAVPDITEAQNPVRIEKINGKIEFKGVTFGYEPNKTVLRSIDLVVQPGEVLGIVGKSGAGKSTLINLISRLYDPGEGRVLIDDINLRDIAFDCLYSSVAMVSQETYLFMGTVAENIAYAAPDTPTADIIKAARLAHAHDFICTMPDGYDTVIGAGGRELSGGQRQRISIARAILADPRILVLDEATAAVDTETEQKIQNSLDLLSKGRTTIMIAHRLSTLKNADRLIVIDEGEIVEMGTHDELLQQGGEYARLVEIQQTALAMRGLE